MQTDKKELAMTQRTPEEMMNLILSRAENDAHIRVVGMEGSRTNQNRISMSPILSMTPRSTPKTTHG